VAPKEDEGAAAERKRKILEEAKAKLEAEQKAAVSRATFAGMQEGLWL
jgi:hypothetical protein